MPRETNAAKSARLRKIIAGLEKAYPDAHCELNHASPLELLVATILSAQCTDKRVNLVTAELFKKYRSAADYARAPLGELVDIMDVGFTCAFLATPYARRLTGSTIYVDGGVNIMA